MSTLRLVCLISTYLIFSNLFSQPLLTKSTFSSEKREIRTMAEWEEVEYLLLSWVQYPSTLREIVRYAQEEVEVLIVCNDSLKVISFLQAGQVAIKNISFIHANPNSVWIRDYGPQTVYLDGVDSLTLVDWVYNRPRSQDDQLSAIIAKKLGVPLLSTVDTSNHLVNIGGNFLTDGMGTAFSSKLVLKENIELSPFNHFSSDEEDINRVMNDYMGINRYIKLPMLPYDRIHHIDMHLKLLDEETLLVGEYPRGIADGPMIEKNLTYIQNNYTSPFGTPYRIIRIPMPPHKGYYPDARWANYRTYTNSVFINRLILVPQYDCPEDSLALSIYKQYFPAHKIIGIDVNQIIQSGGALHCVTQTIGVKDPLRIVHQPYSAISPYQRTIEIEAEITHASGIASANIFYSKHSQKGFIPVEMHLADAATNRWTATIKVPRNTEQLYYFIEAKAYSGKQIRRPLTSPEGAWQVEVKYWPSYMR